MKEDLALEMFALERDVGQLGPDRVAAFNWDALLQLDSSNGWPRSDQESAMNRWILDCHRPRR
jgi:hypothetical protein